MDLWSQICDIPWDPMPPHPNPISQFSSRISRASRTYSFIIILSWCVTLQIYDILEIPPDLRPTWSHESGQIVVDKSRHWHGLLLCMWVMWGWRPDLHDLCCFVSDLLCC